MIPVKQLALTLPQATPFAASGTGQKPENAGYCNAMGPCVLARSAVATGPITPTLTRVM